MSNRLLDEIVSYFALQAKAPNRFRRNLRLQLERICEVVEVSEVPVAIRDPKDVHVLAAAYATKARALISGDRDLLELGKVGITAIITPKAFLAL